MMTAPDDFAQRPRVIDLLVFGGEPFVQRPDVAILLMALFGLPFAFSEATGGVHQNWSTVLLAIQAVALTAAVLTLNRALFAPAASAGDWARLAWPAAAALLIGGAIISGMIFFGAGVGAAILGAGFLESWGLTRPMQDAAGVVIGATGLYVALRLAPSFAGAADQGRFVLFAAWGWTNWLGLQMALAAALGLGLPLLASHFVTDMMRLVSAPPALVGLTNGVVFGAVVVFLAGILTGVYRWAEEVGRVRA